MPKGGIILDDVEVFYKFTFKKSPTKRPRTSFVFKHIPVKDIKYIY